MALRWQEYILVRSADSRFVGRRASEVVGRCRKTACTRARRCLYCRNSYRGQLPSLLLQAPAGSCLLLCTYLLVHAECCREADESTRSQWHRGRDGDHLVDVGADKCCACTRQSCGLVASDILHTEYVWPGYVFVFHTIIRLVSLDPAGSGHQGKRLMSRVEVETRETAYVHTAHVRQYGRTRRRSEAPAV